VQNFEIVTKRLNVKDNLKAEEKEDVYYSHHTLYMFKLPEDEDNRSPIASTGLIKKWKKLNRDHFGSFWLFSTNVYSKGESNTDLPNHFYLIIQ
jgi:hypothetical protein